MPRISALTTDSAPSSDDYLVTVDNATSTSKKATINNVVNAATIAESNVTNLVSDLALKAPKASPTFTGTPIAPTATVGTNTTQIATTAFVAAAASATADPVFFNVKTYGAVGDGSHDDTTNIQNAITAALATTKGTATVYFPAGTYKITAALNCTSATGSASGKGVILRGDGHEASQIFKNSSFGCAVTFNGSGGPASFPTQFGGMVDITINGNATTGGLLQTNSAQQMFFRGCSFIGSNDWAWDLNTMQDSYFTQCTFNNNGSTSAPVIKIYGSSGGTANMLWFSQIRIETFYNGAVWITRGAGASGGGNNGFFWSQCKFENYPTVHGDIFVADGYTQQLVMDQIFFSIGLYDGVYATPANMIVFGDSTTGSGLNQATFTNIFSNAGPTANICNSVINVKGYSAMTGPVVMNNIYSDATCNTAAVIINSASTMNMNISNIYSSSGTAISTDGTSGLATSGKVLTANGTAALPTYQTAGSSVSGVITCANLTQGGGANTTSATTASITPAANKLILLAISIRNGASTNPTAPSVAGNSLTWVQVGSTVVYDSTSSSRRSLFLFRAMGASPTTGTVVITFGETETDASWTIDQLTNANTSGTNGSGAIVQTVTSTTDPATATSLTETLAAFSSSLNAAYGAFGTDGQTGATAGTGLALVGHGNSSANCTTDTEFESAPQTTVGMSFGGSALIGGIACEIKANIVG